MSDAAAALRSMAQSCGAVRRAAAALQQHIAAMVATWTELKQAITKCQQLTGGGIEYPGLGVPEMRWLCQQELSRVGCAVNRNVLEADLPGAKVPPYIDDLRPLVDEVEAATRYWQAVFRARLEAAGAGNADA